MSPVVESPQTVGRLSPIVNGTQHPPSARRSELGGRHRPGSKHLSRVERPGTKSTRTTTRMNPYHRIGSTGYGRRATYRVIGTGTGARTSRRATGPARTAPGRRGRPGRGRTASDVTGRTASAGGTTVSAGRQRRARRVNPVEVDAGEDPPRGGSDGGADRMAAADVASTQ